GARRYCQRSSVSVHHGYRLRRRRSGSRFCVRATGLPELRGVELRHPGAKRRRRHHHGECDVLRAKRYRGGESAGQRRSRGVRNLLSAVDLAIAAGLHRKRRRDQQWRTHRRDSEPHQMSASLPVLRLIVAIGIAVVALFPVEGSVQRTEAASAPNDPRFGEQWGLQRIGAQTAWDTTTGSGSVVVAVVDTGVDLGHPDLQGHLVDGHNFVRKDRPPQDDNGHGTHVAGTIAATLNNNIGIVGVAPGVSIMPIKALSRTGAGVDEPAARGIRWAVDHGAWVINLSFGESVKNT